jgi:hypothetical protein
VNQQPGKDRVLDLLREALEGDVAQIDELRSASKEQLYEASQVLGGQLTFGRPTVLRVLRDWRARKLSDEQVRWWALLMFAGAFPDEWTPYGWRFHASSAQPIVVDYSDHDDVNEVVFRLKDLGDFDDAGAIKAEVDAMIKRLDLE